MKSSSITQSTNGATLVDILERVLDKGIVIAGDIKIKLVDIELLSIQIRLVVCSVDKATEMGMDWWKNGNSFLNNSPSVDALNKQQTEIEGQTLKAIQALNDRLSNIENGMQALEMRKNHD